GGVAITAGRSAAGASGHFRIALGHRGAARQFHAAFFIHAQALDPDLVADFHDVLSLLHAEVGQFADVNEAILAGQEFHECAEFLDGDDFSAVDLADLRLGRHAFDGFAGDLHSLFGD